VDSEGNPSPEGVTNCTSVIDYALISRINFSKDNLSPNEKRMVFILWLLSIFFESIFPTKPIMALIGEKGSGKSIIARMVGLLMFGEGFNVVPLSNDPSDFDAAVTNSLYVAFDNCDSPSPWLNDRLALVATGGNIAKRSLYTTNELVDIPVKCFLALTAHSPQFTREDVAERLLIMNVRRLERFLPEHEILTEILRLRNLLMREVVGYIQEITRALKGWTGPSEGSRFRVADFADFALKVAQYAGVEAEMKVVFRKLSSEQSSFALDDEPLVELLREWAAANPNAEVTNAELCTALGALAGVNGAHFAYKTPRAFGQKMKNLRSNLTEFFDINERPAGGHKKLYTYAIKQRET